MARLFTTGFETGELNEHNGAIGSHGLGQQVTSTFRRTGEYSWKAAGITNSVTTYSYFTHTLGCLSQPQEIYTRFALMIGGVGEATTGLQGLVNLVDTAGASHLSLGFNSVDFYLRLKSGGTGVMAQNGGSDLASGCIVLKSERWYVIEMYAKIANSGGQCTVKVNSATDFTYNGDTCISSDEFTRVIRFGTNGVGVGDGCGFICFDDVAVNDVVGSYQNTWIGLGGVYLLKPTADGATTDWEPSAGTVHYQMVDEVPANTTDWVQDVDSGEVELFEVEDCPAYINQINLVEVLYQAAILESGYNELRDLVRQGTVNYAGTTHTIVNLVDDYELYKGTVHYVQPADGSTAWGTADVNAMEAGFEIP